MYMRFVETTGGYDISVETFGVCGIVYMVIGLANDYPFVAKFGMTDPFGGGYNIWHSLADHI